jgi:hypothetical protein
VVDDVVVVVDVSVVDDVSFVVEVSSMTELSVTLVAVVVVSDDPEQPMVKATRGKSNRFI